MSPIESSPSALIVRDGQSGPFSFRLSPTNGKPFRILDRSEATWGKIDFSPPMGEPALSHRATIAILPEKISGSEVAGIAIKTSAGDISIPVVILNNKMGSPAAVAESRAER